MIDVFIKGRRYRTNAHAKYNESTNEIVVIKGSVVSEDIREFVHKEAITELRNTTTDQNGLLTKDLHFNNPTAAAEYVCGYSVSGLLAWHVERHKTLADFLKNK